MSAASTYQFRHSVPNRSATARPRSLSLAEYQPLTFDRDRVEAAYQQSLQQPASSAATSINLSQPSLSSFSGPNSTDTHATSFSTLSHNLKAGDNPHAASTPHLPLAPPTIPGGGYGNFAGVGAGHSLTPPDSPEHRDAQQLHRQSILSPVPGSPLPPTPPQRPMTLPESTFRRDVDVAADRAQAQDQTMHPGIRRGHSAMDVDGNAALAVESGGTASQSEPFENNSPRGRGKRRALPDVPTNVPQPVSGRDSAFTPCDLLCIWLPTHPIPTLNRPDWTRQLTEYCLQSISGTAHVGVRHVQIPSTPCHVYFQRLDKSQDADAD